MRSWLHLLSQDSCGDSLLTFRQSIFSSKTDKKMQESEVVSRVKLLLCLIPNWTEVKPWGQGAGCRKVIMYELRSLYELLRPSCLFPALVVEPPFHFQSRVCCSLSRQVERLWFSASMQVDVCSAGPRSNFFSMFLEAREHAYYLQGLRTGRGGGRCS